MARPFISHDGEDPQGVRAEVVVEAHTGTVKEISELDKVAKVSFLGDGLNNPVHGYIQLEDPVLDIIKAAKKSKETVEYRIEIIRKNGVARDVPMSELRETMEKARDNVTKIIAGINGVLTTEARTNPAEDTASGGVYKATEMKPGSGSKGKGSAGPSPEESLAILERAVQAGLPHEPLSALLAATIHAGVDPAQALAVAYPKEQEVKVQAVRSREEPVYRSHNTDGSLNLGSSQIIAGVSSENFARRSLTPIADKVDNFNELVEKYASIILAIADNIQISAYGNGNADRMAGSHTRIRGVVYDVIDNSFPPAVLNEGCTPADEFQWVANVGRVAKERFFSAIRISGSNFSFASLKGDTPAPKTEAPKAEASAPVAVEEAPVAVETHVEEAPVVEGTSATEDAQHEAPAVDEDEDFELFDFTEIDPSAPKAAVKDINALKALLKKFEVPDSEINKVGSLLEFSFGTRLAKEVPAELLNEFVAFYKENGKDNLHAALRNVEELLERD